jgi:hypothetical protein
MRWIAAVEMTSTAGTSEMSRTACAAVSSEAAGEADAAASESKLKECVWVMPTSLPHR